ncbi:hypothetical protein [Streptomyces sp. NPDC059009]|uniref:hypothetical protein n=1 Tax=Streptomyces sp. NPDC059009 TaxID=3346694 RepID=UPI0036A7C3CF
MVFELCFEELPAHETGTRLCLAVDAMSAAHRALHELGMTSHSATLPDWPEPEDFGITDEDMERYIADPPASMPRPVRAFNDALAKVAEAEADHPDGIPCYKLSSNQGWLVTPREIAAALGWWAAADPGLRQKVTGALEWWPCLVGFLRRARDLGGFRVW